VYDQIRALVSPEPVAKKFPVGLGATEMTEFLWPWSMSCVWPVRGSQNWTPRSLEPERTHWLSGVRATLSTKSFKAVLAILSGLEYRTVHTLCPSKVFVHRPPLRGGCWFMPRGAESSHILIVLSKLPLTSSRPLGEKATL